MENKPTLASGSHIGTCFQLSLNTAFLNADKGALSTQGREEKKNQPTLWYIYHRPNTHCHKGWHLSVLSWNKECADFSTLTAQELSHSKSQDFLGQFKRTPTPWIWSCTSGEPPVAEPSTQPMRDALKIYSSSSLNLLTSLGLITPSTCQHILLLFWLPAALNKEK